MSKLKIKGKVYYLNMVPAKNATVKITDMDVGNSNDLIFNKKTDAAGEFSGISSPWKDNFMDTMSLKFDVSVDNKMHSGPFVHMSDYKSVPIVLPFLPPNVKTHLFTVNGKECSDANDIQKKARATLESGVSKVAIGIYGPDSAIFTPMTGTLTQLKTKVNSRIPGAADMLYSNPITGAELAGIAIIILAFGAAYSVSIIATAIAVSLIIALFLGYKDIKVKVSNSGGDNPLPGVEFEISK